jgi:hypothetical protein
MSKLSEVITTQVVQTLQKLGDRPEFESIGLVVVAFNHDGDLAVLAPDGYPVADVLRAALEKITGVTPDVSRLIGPAN